MTWYLGIMDLILRLPKNEGSTYGTLTRESDLANAESSSLIHTQFISFHSWASVKSCYTYDVVYDFHRIRCAMTNNDLFSFLESNSPLDYPTLTPLVSFVSSCASLEAVLIHSLGTLTLTDIDYVSIMKSSVMKYHTEMRWNQRPK